MTTGRINQVTSLVTERATSSALASGQAKRRTSPEGIGTSRTNAMELITKNAFLVLLLTPKAAKQISSSLVTSPWLSVTKRKHNFKEE